MGNIVLLDDLTINKIAAGEVIERPASVVKEVVENSIDAGANNISIEIKNGGISYIRITDNGKGIEADDLEIAFERHATSKIRNADDLETVKSMGFRGEALASIAAIARVELVSKTEKSDTGYKIVVEGGKIISKEEVGCPKGTTITIENLFYNTPVRYKFLKKDFTESGYIEDAITRIALVNPNIAIKFINSGKTVIQTSGNGEIKDIVYGIYGKDIAENIVNVEYYFEDMAVKGVIGKPSIARSNRANQLFFVNKRFVKDKTLTSAAEQAFKGLLPIGKYGFLILNVEIDPHKLDVNVHPAKLEVRFQDESKVFKLVYHAIKEVLLKENTVENAENIFGDKYSKNSYIDELNSMKETDNESKGLGGFFKNKFHKNDFGGNEINVVESVYKDKHIHDSHIDGYAVNDELNANKNAEYNNLIVKENGKIELANDEQRESFNFSNLSNHNYTQGIEDFLKRNNIDNSKIEKIISSNGNETAKSYENNGSNINVNNYEAIKNNENSSINSNSINSLENKEYEDIISKKDEQFNNKLQSDLIENIEQFVKTTGENDFIDNLSKKLELRKENIESNGKIENPLEKNMGQPEKFNINLDSKLNSQINEQMNFKQEGKINLDLENLGRIQTDRKVNIESETKLENYNIKKEIETKLEDYNIQKESETKLENYDTKKETELKLEGYNTQKEFETESKDYSIKKESETKSENVEVQKETDLSFEEMYAKMFGTTISKNRVEEDDDKGGYQIKTEELKPTENLSLFNNTNVYGGPIYKFIGIAFNEYIIVEYEREMFIIDQRAANERILYEKIKSNYYNDTDKDSQLMLLPDIINLSHKEMGIAKDTLELFKKAGFDIEEFGENTIKLSGVPNMCIDLDTKELYLQTLNEINTVARTAKNEIEEKLITTIASKVAENVSIALTEPEVDGLMQKLLSLPNPFMCPNGNVAAMKMSKIDIEKKFSRR